MPLLDHAAGRPRRLEPRPVGGSVPCSAGGSGEVGFADGSTPAIPAGLLDIGLATG